LSPGREESRRALEDLVGPSQLAVLPLQLDQPPALLGGQPWPLTLVDLGLLDPIAHRLGPNPELTSDAADCAKPLAGLGNRGLDHPDRPLMKLGRVPAL